jgi:uncharacterized membrane protein YkvA (DUF1232 family)
MKVLLWLRLAQMARHIPNFFKLFWRLIWDGRVSFLAKMLLILIPAYIYSPLDMLTNVFNSFFPGLGWVDDVVVIYLVLRVFIAFCPPKVVAEHVARIETENHPRIT